MVRPSARAGVARIRRSRRETSSPSSASEVAQTTASSPSRKASRMALRLAFGVRPVSAAAATSSSQSFAARCSQ